MRKAGIEKRRKRLTFGGGREGKDILKEGREG